MIGADIQELDGGCPVVESDAVTATKLVLTETPRGGLTLPTARYEQIDGSFPLCLRRGDDDAPAEQHFARLQLRSTNGDTTTLHTRNTWMVKSLLDQAGVSCEIVRHFEASDCREPIEKAKALLALTTPFRSEVDTITNDDWHALDIGRYGQIVARDARQKFSIAAMLCAAFPRAPIVLVVASQAEVEQVAAELEIRLNQSVHRGFGIYAGLERRITVATYVAFRGEDLRDAPFVIVPNWRHGYPTWMKMITWGPFRDRIYFLRTAAERLSDVDADGLFGRLGAVLIQPPRPMAFHTVSQFQFGGRSRCHGPRRPLRRSAFTLDMKLKLYWRHRRRNQAIVALAEDAARESGAMAILVEGVEHATKLAAMLSGWSVVQMTTLPDTMPSRCIVTLVAADAWRAFRPDRLVFASGGEPSSWLDGWLSEMRDIGHEVQIIDLTDAFDSRAAVLAQARMAAYRRAGCHWRPLLNQTVQRVGRALRDAEKLEKRRRTNVNTTR